jgi:putative copper resistance protein D
VADWGLIAIRFALYADLMLLVGLAAFPLYSFTRDEREDSKILPLAAPLTSLAFAGLIISAFAFALSSAAMMGVPLAEIDVTMLLSMASETDQGAAWLVRSASLAAAFACLIALRRRRSLQYGLALASGAVALATLLWSGHAAATEGALGTVHRISDIAHIIAGAVWIGGIAAFALLLRTRAETQGAARIAIVRRALTDFARVGTVAVAIILITGIANGYAIFGAEVATVFTSTYGLLLFLKVALVGAMLLIAANNRWRLTPALEQATDDADETTAWKRLRLSVALEAMAAVAILALVAWLGTLMPSGL